jgi:predicted dehydrogenase
MTTPSLRYTIVGAGAGIADLHLKALAQMPGARIAGMCDVSAERGRPRADAAGCPFFLDHRDMIEATRPDVVVICTPHPFHAAIAIDAVTSGAHVLTEKPMAIQVGDADRMNDAADAAGRWIAVNFQMRFRPAIERARAFIAEGGTGELMRVQVTECWYRTKAYYDLGDWRGTWRGEGGAILMNQSTHTMDLLCHLAGQPARVWGWARTRLHPIECEDTAQAMLEFANGAPGYFSSSTAEPIAGPRQRILIVGELGLVELGDSCVTLARYRTPVREHIRTATSAWDMPEMEFDTLDLPGDGGGHLAVYRDLAAAIAEGRPPRVSGREGVQSLELANAILYSSHTNRPVSLPLDRGAYAQFLTTMQTA